VEFSKIAFSGRLRAPQEGAADPVQLTLWYRVYDLYVCYQEVNTFVTIILNAVVFFLKTIRIVKF